MKKEPVDAVITWVDGNDKAHASKLAAYLKKMGITRPEVAAPTRFNARGEIDYCVKSILHFAPWIRTIYIVTGGQTPSIMKELIGTPYKDKVRLVDERDIFSGYESCLPMFNSITVESMLWRIKGIANNFIYFNDDWSIIRPVSYEDFFRNNNIVLRGRWKILSEKSVDNYWKRFLGYVLKKPHHPPERDVYRVVQENSAKLAGLHVFYFYLRHAPIPAKKKTFEDFFQKYPDALLQNIRHAFRDRRQFLPLSLSLHLDVKNKLVVRDRTLRTIMVDGACDSLEKMQSRLELADRNKHVTFICMQSMDMAAESTQKVVFNWLDKRIEQ